MTFKHLTVQNAHLVIRALIFKPSQSLLFGDDPGKIEVYCVEYFVVGHATFHCVKLLLRNASRL